MKKQLLILLSAGSIAFSAEAQMSKQSVVLTAPEFTSEARTIGSVDKSVHAALKGRTANRTTAGTSRWYSYPGYFDTTAPSTGLGVQIIWNDTSGQVIYTSGLAHNRMVSTGVLFHPQFAGFNDASLYPGEMSVGASNAYTIDSVNLYGIYGFNPAKTSVCDTLRLTFVKGDGSSSSDVYSAYFNNATLLSNYGVSDTALFFKYYGYDSTKNTATGATRYSFNIPLCSTAWGDTLDNGIWARTIALPTPFNVDAGSMVGMSITFKSGDATFVPHDTLFRGSGFAAGIYKYNLFRPLLIYNQSGTAPTFAPYDPNDNNIGLYKTLPNSSNGWGGDYIPMWAWSSTGGVASSLQHGYVDFHVSCPTCGSTGISNTANNIVSVKAMPNPADNKLNVTFDLATASDATVTLTNAVGQVVATQHASAKHGAVTFNTAAIPAGVYIYTVTANGQRTNGQVVIAH